MDKAKKETEEEFCATYRRQIVEMVEEIENPMVLVKICTVVRTHLEILKEKEQEN